MRIFITACLASAIRRNKKTIVRQYTAVRSTHHSSESSAARHSAVWTWACLAYDVPEVLNVHVNENNEKIYFF